MFFFKFSISFCLGIGGKRYGPTTSADLSTMFDVGGIIGKALNIAFHKGVIKYNQIS